MKKDHGLLVVLLLLGLRSARRQMLTMDQVVELARSVGFPSPELAAAVAWAESGGNALAVGDFGRSYGLWQIHTPAHPQYSPGVLFDALGNARAAFAISRGGADWQPWTTFRNGAFRRFMRPSP